MTVIGAQAPLQFQPPSNVFQIAAAPQRSEGPEQGGGLGEAREAAGGAGEAREGAGHEGGSEAPGADQLQAKANELIDAQKLAGRLTSQQADQLVSLLEQAITNNPNSREANGSGRSEGPEGAEGAGGSEGPEGPEGTGANSPLGQFSQSNQFNQVLEDFFQILRDQQGSSYGTSGTMNGEASVLFSYKS